MSEQPYGFNKDDLQGAVSIGFAVSAVIVGAIGNRPDAAEEALRLCGVLEYALVEAGVDARTALGVAANIHQRVSEAIGAPE